MISPMFSPVNNIILREKLGKHKYGIHLLWYINIYVYNVCVNKE